MSPPVLSLVAVFFHCDMPMSAKTNKHFCFSTHWQEFVKKKRCSDLGKKNKASPSPALENIRDSPDCAVQKQPHIVFEHRGAGISRKNL